MRNLVELLVPRSDTWLPQSLAQQIAESERLGVTSWFNKLELKNLAFMADVDGLFDPYDDLKWADYYLKLSIEALDAELTLLETKLGLVGLNRNYEHDLHRVQELFHPHTIADFHIQCRREEGHKIAMLAESDDQAKRHSVPLIQW